MIIDEILKQSLKLSFSEWLTYLELRKTIIGIYEYVIEKH